MNIRYVKHNDIDFKKWDKCITKAINGSVYGYSWFLDIVAKEWDALLDLWDLIEIEKRLVNRVFEVMGRRFGAAVANPAVVDLRSKLFRQEKSTPRA